MTVWWAPRPRGAAQRPRVRAQRCAVSCRCVQLALLLAAAPLLAAAREAPGTGGITSSSRATPAPAAVSKAPPAAAAPVATPAKATAPAASVSPSAASAAAPADTHMLHIAHVNDVHNRLEQTGPTSAACSEQNAQDETCLGGWARIATAVKEARRRAAAEKAGFLFLDIGDEFDGTLWDVVYKGQATAQVQNMVQPDAMTLGNHEFSFPPADLAAYITKLKTPMLGGCNVDASDEPALAGRFKKWAVFQIGSYKVAALGWLTPETAYLQLNSGKVKFNDIVPSVRRCIGELKRAHPDVAYIIGMSHTGYNVDLQTAKQLPEIDIILGGHSHTFLNLGDKPGPIFDKTKGATPEDCVEKGACDMPAGLFPTLVSTKLCTGGVCRDKQIPVVQAYFASKYMGQLKIDLAAKKLVASDPLLLGGPASSNPVEPDAAVAAAIQSLEGPVKALQGKPVGKTAVEMVGGNLGRQEETNFGSLMASLLVKTAKSLDALDAQFGPVDIGLFTGGGIRVDILPGQVTYGDVLTAMPFGNTFAIKAATGAQIREALSNGLSGMANNAGRFPQVAGLRFWHRGGKLLAAKRLLPDGSTAPLDDATSYNVASTTYLFSGGDGYSMFAKAPYIYPSGDTMDKILMDEFRGAMPNAIIVPVPEKERRIINCAASYVDCANTQLYGPCCPARAASTAARAG